MFFFCIAFDNNQNDIFDIEIIAHRIAKRKSNISNLNRSSNAVHRFCHRNFQYNIAFFRFQTQVSIQKHTVSPKRRYTQYKPNSNHAPYGIVVGIDGRCSLVIWYRHYIWWLPNCAAVRSKLHYMHYMSVSALRLSILFERNEGRRRLVANVYYTCVLCCTIQAQAYPSNAYVILYAI